MIYKNILINRIDDKYFTDGVAKFIGKEIVVSALTKNEQEYIEVFEYLIDYITDQMPEIYSEQTISYKSWILKFINNSKGQYELYEGNDDGSGFVRGVDTAISVVKSQDEVCREFDVIPNYPTFGQLVVVSKGVYEGEPLQGVRYPSPSHMSGWWLTTDLYDGNINSLLTVHYHHIVFNRPHIVKYLALPFGFRFYLSENQNDVYFDPKTLNKD